MKEATSITYTMGNNLITYLEKNDINITRMQEFIAFCVKTHFKNIDLVIYEDQNSNVSVVVFDNNDTTEAERLLIMCEVDPHYRQ